MATETRDIHAKEVLVEVGGIAFYRYADGRLVHAYCGISHDSMESELMCDWEFSVKAALVPEEFLDRETA